MQLNPARGRKRLHLLPGPPVPDPRLMQLNPARGRKRIQDVFSDSSMERFMQLNPARGRKLRRHPDACLYALSWFMQLNPARGRKRGEHTDVVNRHITLRFMQLNPARGRKLIQSHACHAGVETEVYAAQPREGTETYWDWFISKTLIGYGLCSSTPRGDGNFS